MGYEETIMLLVVLIPLGIAWLCTRLAKSRGRDPVFWGILGFCFNVMALVILLILPERKERIYGHKGSTYY